MKKETASIRFLYGTAAGRVCLKVLVCPWISKVAGAFLSSSLSRPMVGRFVKKNKIDMSAYPARKYRSFNDFFTRKRETSGICVPPDTLVSPCDAYLSVYPIDEKSVFHIKHIDYSLAQLLDDAALAERFSGGSCLIFRLTPLHYHRYCFCCNAEIVASRRIDGKLHCVRPIAYTSRPVFIENSRSYTLLHDDALGTLVQMEVGALLVGKIKNHPTSGRAVAAAEKGYFEFGGSTIIVLLEKDRVRLTPTLQTQEEKDIRYADTLGTIIRKR